MARLARWALITLVSLGGIGAIIWMFRIEIILFGVEFAVNRSNPVAPSGTVTWSSGPREPTFGNNRPPNVVLIVTDDMGWNDISLNGGVAGGMVKTPHIDSIARQGVNFTQGYAANATCAPSRAALMSGRYSTRFGFEFTPVPEGMMPIITFIRNSMPTIGPGLIVSPEAKSLSVDDPRLGMPADEITLAEILKARGYYTAHIGKWHLGRGPGMMPQEQGFDDSLHMLSGLYARKDDPSIVKAAQDFDPIDRFLWRAGQFSSSFNGGAAFEPPAYMTDYYSDQAVEVIRNNRNRPFFLYLAYFAPHNPLQAKQEDYDAYPDIALHRERVYGGIMRSLDRGIGSVLEALREEGLEEDTLVIFTSDNGGAGYIGLPHVNRPYRGWKMTYFEGGLRVPFLAKWPGVIPAGVEFDRPVQHFDIFATVASAAGASLPQDRTMDGVNLLPFLTGETVSDPHTALFWRSGAAQAVRMGRYKLIVSAPPGQPRQEWLVDLEADETEQRNLLADMPDKATELRAALEAHNAEQAPPNWEAYVHAAQNVDRDAGQSFLSDDTFAYWSN